MRFTAGSHMSPADEVYCGWRCFKADEVYCEFPRRRGLLRVDVLNPRRRGLRRVWRRHRGTHS